jgi:hypothetical protein
MPSIGRGCKQAPESCEPIGDEGTKASEEVDIKAIRRLLEMEINAQVGETAGKVWHLLNDEGPKTFAQLKKKLNGSGELVSFAVGWLAREDKVDITNEKKTVKLTLK